MVRPVAATSWITTWFGYDQAGDLTPASTAAGPRAS